jgi:hypothetical protein
LTGFGRDQAVKRCVTLLKTTQYHPVRRSVRCVRFPFRSGAYADVANRNSNCVIIADVIGTKCIARVERIVVLMTLTIFKSFLFSQTLVESISDCWNSTKSPRNLANFSVLDI